MDPQGGSEAELLHAPHHSLWVWELFWIELCVTVADLPVIVNLQLTILKAVLHNVLGKLQYDGLIDLGLVLGPAGPHGVGEHLK